MNEKANARSNEQQTDLKDIDYHHGFDGNFNWWAESCKWTPSYDLHRATTSAVRTRHHLAQILPKPDDASERYPDVIRLPLGDANGVHVIYTVESEAIVIRGYKWTEPGEPGEKDCEYGGFFGEIDWTLPSSRE